MGSIGISDIDVELPIFSEDSMHRYVVTECSWIPLARRTK
jgi:hypothetical protein